MNKPTDPLWLLVCEDHRKRAKPMHRQERYAYTEGFLDAIDALRNDRDGTLRELLDAEPPEPAGPVDEAPPRPPTAPRAGRRWGSRPRG